MSWRRDATSWPAAAAHPWKTRVTLTLGFFAAGVLGALVGGLMHPWPVPVATGLILSLVGVLLGEFRMRREHTFRG